MLALLKLLFSVDYLENILYVIVSKHTFSHFNNYESKMHVTIGSILGFIDYCKYIKILHILFNECL